MVKRALTGFLALTVGLACLFVAPTPAAAVLGLRDYEDATAVLNHYGLVQGDERGYRFMDQISRAEMAKVVVYALGLEGEAEQMRGRNEFPDVPRGSWYEGIVSMARQVGLMEGSNGLFRPQDNITYAEVLTVLSRLVGLQPSREPWPATYLRPAQTAGIIPAGTDFTHRLRDDAIRGDVFVLLKRTLVDVKNADGQNLAQRYLATNPPIVVIDPQPTTTIGSQLTLSGYTQGAARLTVNGEPVTMTGGFFRTDVDLRMGPNTIQVQAFDYAGNITTETVQIERLAGNIASIYLTGPEQVVAGQNAQFTMVVRDQNNAILTDTSGITVEVTGAPGQFDLRTGRFVAGKEAGISTIWLTAGDVQTSASITITAGALSRIAIEPSEVGLAPGETVKFEVTGYDVHGNVVPVGDVSWSATAGSINSQGFYEAPAVNNGATVTARAGGRTAQAKVLQANYQVNRVVMAPLTPGAANISMRANGISTARLEVKVLDNAGMLVTDYRGTLTVTSSDANVASVPATVTVMDGVAEIVVTAGTKAGSTIISARTNTGRVATQTVTTTAQQLQSVRLEGVHQSSANAQSLGAVEAVALDQDGNPMVSPLRQSVVVTVTVTPANSVQFVSPAAAGNVADIALYGVDTQTGQVRGRAPLTYNPGMGTLYITGTIRPQSMNYVQVLPGSLASGQAGRAARVEIEPIDEIPAGQTRMVYVNVLDSNGYRVTQQASLAGLTVELRDNKGVVWPATATALNNQGQAVFQVLQPEAGNYTYTATLVPNGATHSRTARVVPGGVVQVALTATPESVRADNQTQITLTAELRDAQGNRVRTGAYEVTFRRTTNTGAVQGPTEQVVMSAQGLAQWKVTAGQVVGPESFMVTVIPNPATPAEQLTATTTINTTGLAQRLRLSYGDNDGDGVANGPGDHIGQVGRPLTVVVEVLDDRPNPNVVASDTGRRITLTVRRPNNTTQTYQGQTVNGRVTLQVQQTSTGSYSLRADSTGLIPAMSIGYGGTAVDMVLQPSHVANLELVSDLNVLQVNGIGQSFARVRVRLLDANGNLTTNQTGAPLVVTLTNTNQTATSGYFTANDTAGGTKTQTRTVVIAQGASESLAVTFFAGTSPATNALRADTIDGRSVTKSISSTTLGQLHALNVTFDPPSLMPNAPNWVGAVGVTTVVATAVDSSQRRLTGYTGNVTLTVPADMQIVEVWNKATGTWVPLATGQTTHQISADRGEARFRVLPVGGGVKDIKVETGTVSTMRQMDYVGQVPTQLLWDRDKTRITAGERLLIPIRAVTADGEPIFSLGSPITFTIMQGTGSLSTSATGAGLTGPVVAPLVSGQALVYYIPVAGMGNDHQVRVRASVAGLERDIEFWVDDIRPRVTGIFITGGGDGIVHAGESITITFTEELQASSVLAGLTQGGSVTSGLSAARVEFTATNRINFVGLPLGTITLGNEAVGSSGTHYVTEVRLSADGLSVTVVLGGPIAAPAQVTMPGTVPTVTPNNVVKDTAGNGADSSTNVVVNGGF